LDYDYLVELAAGPQRLYELLSFCSDVWSTGEREIARETRNSSEYCLYAPQARYLVFDQVKKQLYKVHVPHRESGYIARTEFKQISDREGKPDWEIFYVPGPKAIREYQVFTNRQLGNAQPESLRRPVAGVIRNLDLSESENNCVIEFARRGVTTRKARELVIVRQTGQQIIDQIEYVDTLVAAVPKGKFHNPPVLCQVHPRTMHPFRKRF
jgi:hypothetical protein